MLASAAMPSPALDAPAPCRPMKEVFWKAIPEGAKLSTRMRVYRCLVDRSAPDEPIRVLDRVIARELGIRRQSVNRAIGQLEKEGWIEITGSTRSRLIRVLVRPKPAPGKRPRIARAFEDNQQPTCNRSARNPDERKSKSRKPMNEVSGQGSLFERIEERENVNVPSVFEENPHAHAREAPDDSTPIVPIVAEPSDLPGTPLAEAGPGPDRGVVAAAEASAAPVPVPGPLDGFDPELAGLTIEELKARIARLKNRRLPGQGWELMMAEAVLEAKLAAAGEPPLTVRVPPLQPPPKPADVPPRPQPPAPRPMVQARHVETVDLIGKLATPAGPSMVEVIVQRLCERVDPAFEPCFRKACADVLSGKLDAWAVQAAFKGCRTAMKPGPAFSAVIKKAREKRRAKDPRPEARRE